MVHTTHPISAHRIWKVRLRILRLLVTSNPFLHLCMGSERTRLSESNPCFQNEAPRRLIGIPVLVSFTEDWQPSSKPTRQKRTEIIVHWGCFIRIPQSAFTHRTERLYGRPCQEKCLTFTWVPSWIEVEEGRPQIGCIMQFYTNQA